MKKIKKLLFTLAALTLVFCSLSSVMTVSALNANQKLCKKAISSITLTIGDQKAKVPLEDYPDATEMLTDALEVKVKVKLKKDWKLKKMSYYDAGTGKTTKIKNGGSFPISESPGSCLTIKMENKKKNKTCKYKLYAFHP